MYILTKKVENTINTYIYIVYIYTYFCDETVVISGKESSRRTCS